MKLTVLATGSSGNASIVTGENETIALDFGLSFKKWHTLLEKYDLKDLSWNSGEVAFPDYYISGVGTCTISVNGNDFEVKLNGSVILDTERRLIYLPDKTIVNNIGKGDFENLYLQPGQNAISVSKGFVAKAIPHWRCR